MASRKFPWMVHEYCARCAPMDALPILDRERFDLQR
jgi:hypothetical protein